ncbi:TPA: nucleotidyltransferase [Pseudomonas aeruginosa]|nr:nucleotidyltransferase [Pseudomonas aeruginosa]
MSQSSPLDVSQLESWEMVLLRTANEISLSESQYALITQRYETLQDILAAADSPLLKDAHIFVQGSIRLKTTLKPAPEATGEMATIDADAVVWLPNASSADADAVLHAIQKRFEAAARVAAPIEPLRRGIRIVYADENPGFHIDVTPAQNAAGNDAESGEGKLVVPDRIQGWKASSPIAYSEWLERAAAQNIRLTWQVELTKRHMVYDRASQEAMPDYEAYIDGNPLRAAVKLLKRNRDQWAIREQKVSVRPISAVITTLAAKAYEEVAQESQYRPLRPVEAIIEVVRRMPKFIVSRDGHSYVLNPTDSGENFAEKWNRPNGEGEAYRQAFNQWHIAALTDIALGLRDLGSEAAFADEMKKRFGVGKALIEKALGELPGNWTLPGRTQGTTANTVRLGALVGGSAASAASQASIKPVDRLG